jgi:elongation factor 1 alpha-like protein
MDDDDLVIEKDTNTDPSSSVKLDEVGGSSSTVAADAQVKTLLLDNELQNLSLGRKTKNSKAKIKKPNTVSQYKPERWMLQAEDKKMPRQLNLAIVSNRTCVLHSCLSSIIWFLHFAYLYEYVKWNLMLGWSC